ncbi:hypothetical protein HJ590_13300 [Naumannella sp. ID2617S]|nr:hypothetical protein [Naumannella sp. ID2617S]
MTTTSTDTRRVDEPPFDPDYDITTPPDPQDTDRAEAWPASDTPWDEQADPDSIVRCIGDLTIRHLGTDILVRPTGKEPYAGRLTSIRIDGLNGGIAITCGRLRTVALDTRCEVLS